MTDVRDEAAIRADLRTLGRLPVTLADQGAPLRLAGDVAPLLDRCGFLERVLERAERERDDASAELAVLRAQRDAALAVMDGRDNTRCAPIRAALGVQPEPSEQT